MQFKFNPSTAKLTPNSPAFVAVGPGALPRHLAFHPSGDALYLNTEQTNKVIRYRFDAASGTLSQDKEATTTTVAGVEPSLGSALPRLRLQYLKPA